MSEWWGLIGVGIWLFVTFVHGSVFSYAIAISKDNDDADDYAMAWATSFMWPFLWIMAVLILLFGGPIILGKRGRQQ